MFQIHCGGVQSQNDEHGVNVQIFMDLTMCVSGYSCMCVSVHVCMCFYVCVCVVVYLYRCVSVYSCVL